MNRERSTSAADAAASSAGARGPEARPDAEPETEQTAPAGDGEAGHRARPRRRAAAVLMAAGLCGLLGVGAYALLAGRTGGTAGGGAAAGRTAAGPTSPAAADASFSTAPPPLDLKPRLVTGSVLGELTVAGGAPVRIIEGLDVSSDAVAHDERSAYPGEPHEMTLVAGSVADVPLPGVGSDLRVTTAYGGFRYHVTGVSAGTGIPAGDPPGLHLVADGHVVSADYVPGDPQTAAELQEEVAVAQAEQNALANGLPDAAPSRLVAPVRGPITQYFGPSPYGFELPFVYQGVYYPHFHTGLDLGIPTGTPIACAAAGVVILATTNVRNGVPVGYGRYVVVSHGGGVYTLYAHMSQLGVQAGDHVSAGQLLGYSGTTGNSTGPHLHFEVRHGDVPVDPLPLISG